MPRWDPSPIWQGQDVYIIGGGDSLRQFDWDLIRGKHTIGCNSNFILGAHICEMILFGDFLWWEKIGRELLPSYGGVIVGCVPQLWHQQNLPPWLLQMEREEKKVHGLGERTLGWNGNTGAMAVNLALILGAQRVFLLGFDMDLGPDGKPNWHDLRYEKGTADVYPLFVSRFHYVARDLKTMFPGREVINVSDCSKLNVFPKVSLKEHFKKGEVE